MSAATKSPPRFWIDASLALGADIELPESAVRHVAALRLDEGDGVTLFDGSGSEWAAKLVRVMRGRCTARISSRREVDRESPLSILLALGISAGNRMDYALQKATELGVARIVPLATERSVVRLSEARAERRLAHWRGIAAAACEQCGRNRLPRIEPVAELDEFVACPRDGLKLMLVPDGSGKLSELGPQREIVLLIGPEGGLSDHERKAALQAGFAALRFGPRTLRTETAPLAAIAAMQALWGDC